MTLSFIVSLALLRQASFDAKLPLLTDADRFGQSYSECVELHDWHRNVYHRICNTPYPYEEYEDRERRKKYHWDRWDCWMWLERAKNRNLTTQERRLNLGRLRQLIGESNFYNGDIP